MSKKISNVAMVIDCLHSTPKYYQSGYPIVRVEDVNNNFLNFDNCLRVCLEDLKHQNKKYVPQKGDIIITRVGSFGRLSYIDTTEPFCLGQNISIICPKVDSKFLYYYLKSPYAQKFIFGNSNGSSYKSLSLEQINEIPFIDDNLDKEKIGALLYSIDKKIANNSKINSKLESLAKTLYDYWFLQFEFPNKEGNPYKSSGGKMVYNEQLKKEIPEGWEVLNIRDICNVTWGQCPDGKNILPLSYVGDDAILYCSGAGDMRNGLLVDCQAKTNASRRYAYKNDILMSVAGSIGAIAICDKKISLGRAAAAFTSEEKHLMYSYLTIAMFMNRMKSTSSGSIQKVVNDNHLNDMNFAYSEDIVDKFSAYNTLINMQITKEQENQELTSLRDFLLPLLMNGQVTIQDAEQQVNNTISNVWNVEKLLRFAQWKQMQGYAARGEVDEDTLMKIFDTMDKDAKK